MQPAPLPKMQAMQCSSGSRANSGSVSLPAANRDRATGGGYYSRTVIYCPDWAIALCGTYAGDKWYQTVVHPQVEWGKSYCMILSRQGEGEYAVEPAARTCEPGTDEWVAKVRRATTNGWSWGPATKGLQAAIVTGVEGRDAEGWRGCFLALALRNVSDRALDLNACPGDYFLRMRALDPNGRRVEADPNRLFLLQGPEAYDDPRIVRLAPGQVVLTGAWGMGAVGLVLDWVPPGQWMVEVSYRSERTSDKVSLWTGQVWSAPLALRRDRPAENAASQPVSSAHKGSP